MQNSQRIKFFNSQIDALTMEQTLERIDNIIKVGQPSQHVVINVAKLVLMQKDKALCDLINNCRLINADGQGIVWGANLIGQHLPERVAGIDLFIALVERAAQNGYKLYFLGAEEEIITKVIQIFKSHFPNLTIAGYHHGYFTEEEEEGVVENIKNSGADICFVAMSSPKKEYFIQNYLQAMNAPFVMGVGGSFDVVAGKTQRAPLWLQRAGLEWFYRFCCEPRRMWKRYLVTNSIYLGMLLKYFWNHKLLKSAHS